MMYDELIKRLRNRRICIQQSGSFDDFPMLREAADAIEELQKDLERSKDFEAFWQHEAEEALKKFQVAISNKPRWIPVSERLPKENDFYLCLYKHKASGGVAMDEGLSILQWINNKWGINDIYLVTHWMPIPQPPESNGE